MQILRVYPNPWAALDKNGLPCGVCPRDPEADGGGPGHFVGGRVDRNRTKVLQDFSKEVVAVGPGLALKGDPIRSPMQSTVYEYMGIASSDPQLAEKLFALEPIDIPRTSYYRARIAAGELFCADAETATSAKFAHFVPPKELIKRFAPKAEPVTAAPSESVERVSLGGVVSPGIANLTDTDSKKPKGSKSKPDTEGES